MTDFLFNILLILVTLYFINDRYFGFGAEYLYKRALKKLEEKLQLYREGIQLDITTDLIKEVSYLIERQYKMKETYLHLAEKYRHNFLTRRKIQNDWYRYNKSIFNISEQFSGEVSENTSTKINEGKDKDRIIIDEIEKRYTKLFEK